MEIPSRLFFSDPLQLARQLAPKRITERDRIDQNQAVSQGLLGPIQISLGDLDLFRIETAAGIVITMKDLG
jgi:hypothetical protein